jgi:hypothetical protein
MKVIQELVAYFDRAGRLDKAAIGRLLDQGFLASEAPTSMMGLCDTIGATYYFRVKGDASGTAWGTDVYTGDSSLALAAVHAGLVKPEQEAILKVSVVAPPPAFQGSARHGVTSHDFGRFGSAYSLSPV